MKDESLINIATTGIMPILILCLTSPLGAQSPGADSVVAFSPGSNAGYGADSLPQIVLGLPRGGGELEGSLDVVSLGNSGQITLSFEDNIIVDGPGPDFTVFENPFFVAGDSLNRYIETALVEVSQDGICYHRFPFDILPGIEPPGNPHRYAGFAGVDPVMSNDGIPDPTDPLLSGGDQFDLEEVGLPNVRFIRIIDTGSDTYDEDGDLVTDTGLDLPPQAGFDLDAICHINWTSRAFPFEVVSARAISPEAIQVSFSKALEVSQDIPPQFFAIDGRNLTEADSVIRISDTSVELRLDSPQNYGSPLPVLTVSQRLESDTGENLLDPFNREIEAPLGIRDETTSDIDRKRTTPLPCYPNPFNGQTTVSFETSQEAYVKLSVFDVRGKLVKVLMDGHAQGGIHRIIWDGRDDRGMLCPSGIYLVNLELDTSSFRMKIIHQR